jgi:hypothetical protein
VGPFSQDIAGDVEFLGIRPNPFSQTTHLTFRLKVKCRVSVSLLDDSGQVVSRVTDGTLEPGLHEIPVGADLVPGVYLCRLEAGSVAVVKKITRR